MRCWHSCEDLCSSEKQIQVQKERQQNPGLHQMGCGQQVEGGGYAPLLCSSETPPAKSSSGQKKDMELMEQVQRGAMKLTRGLEHFLKRQAGKVGAVSEGGYQEAQEGLFVRN